MFVSNSSNEYLILTSMESLIPHKHTLKFLYKSKNLQLRYKRKREWVFFLMFTLCFLKNIRKTTHSRFLLYLGGKCLDLHKIFKVCLKN